VIFRLSIRQTLSTNQKGSKMEQTQKTTAEANNKLQEQNSKVNLDSKENTDPKTSSTQNSETTSNSEQVGPDIDVKTLFELSIKNADTIKLVRKELDEYYDKKRELKDQLKVIKKSIAPVSRTKQKIRVIELDEKPERAERKELRAKKEEIEEQLFLINDHIEDKEAELSRLTGTSIQYIKKRKLYNKSQSRRYVRNNSHLIRHKLIRFLNQCTDSEHKTELMDLKLKASDTSDEGIQQFSESLRELMDKVNAETAIMCSGVAKKDSYESIRLTLLKWDPEVETQIDELVAIK
jgi:hypothetical protein